MNTKKTNWMGGVAALAFAMAMAAEAVLPRQEVEPRIKALDAPLAQFAYDCGKLPDRLDELLDSDRPGWLGPYVESRESILDPWGREFIYLNNDGKSSTLPYLVASAGPKGNMQAAEAELRAWLEARNKEEDAKKGILTLKSVVLARAINNFAVGGDDNLPDSLQQLVDDGDLPASPDFLVDPWGNEYIYSKEGKDGELCEIFSAGPDGIPGTADDVHAKRDNTASK
jgi:hypothetical protein